MKCGTRALLPTRAPTRRADARARRPTRAERRGGIGGRARRRRARVTPGRASGGGLARGNADAPAERVIMLERGTQRARSARGDLVVASRRACLALGDGLRFPT